MYVAVISEKGRPFLLKLTNQKPLKKKTNPEIQPYKNKNFWHKKYLSQQKKTIEKSVIYIIDKELIYFMNPHK